MNEILEVLKSRRSCRTYQDKQITDQELDKILEAGTYAPTAKNGQSSIMVVVQDKETIAKLSRWNAAVIGADKDTLYGAPTVVIVLGDKNSPHRQVDGACVMQNLMLAAHAQGVDSCWVNRAKEVFETEEGKAQLKEWGIEGEYEGIGNCILGYREGTAQKASPRKENYIYKV